MRIAQVSPLYEAVPPKLYGGTERVVAHLTEELVALGHDVTLFASGDSVTSARLEAVWPCALRLDGGVHDPLAPHLLMLEKLTRCAGAFDVIHLHTDYLGHSLMRRIDVPTVTTLHGRLDLPELRPLYSVFGDVPVVSISDSQRAGLPEANFVATVYHGLPTSSLSPGTGEGGYLAFIGRVSPEKGLDAAIRIAAEAGMPLKIAAKVDKYDQDYFIAQIRPLLAQSHVEFLGEIGDCEKGAFLGNARALLFPIDWPEPFGLIMIEAMACGTPVIARRRGSVPEVVDDGVTGFIVETEAEAVEALRRLDRLDRATVRQVFERRFSARRMAEDYLKVYRCLGVAPERPLLEMV